MPNRSSDEYIMNATPKTESKFDWSAFDALTDEEVHAAAMADSDARPMTEEDLERMPLVPRVTTIRRALKLTQEEFAARFHIPPGTLRDWEQGRSEPDAAARAYLRVIARVPEVVRRALEPLPGPD
jgi:putative transcriptional regulator